MSAGPGQGVPDWSSLELSFPRGWSGRRPELGLNPTRSRPSGGLSERHRIRPYRSLGCKYSVIGSSPCSAPLRTTLGRAATGRIRRSYIGTINLKDWGCPIMAEHVTWALNVWWMNEVEVTEWYWHVTPVSIMWLSGLLHSTEKKFMGYGASIELLINNISRFLFTQNLM